MAEDFLTVLLTESLTEYESTISDESSDFVMLSLLAASVIRQERTKIEGYVENTIPSYQLDDFRRFFRVSRDTFESLCTYLAPNGNLNPSWTGGRECISVEKHLLVTLWYLATQDTIHSISDRFDITESSVIRCRERVYNVVLNDVKPRVIVWPTDQEKQQIINNFREKQHFPGVIGAIDGSHIKIKAPREHSQTYVNRKGFHSVVLQAVCKDDMKFIDCVAGWPGSCHDSRVLKNSDLWTNGPRLCGPGHLLGDAAYPLKAWLLTPFRDNGHLTPEQRHFNTRQSSARTIIERAFALLKGRFRRLQNVDTQKLKTAVNTIMACCVIHNICITKHEEVRDFFLDEPGQNVGNDQMGQQNDVEGATKRHHIARNLN